MNEVRAEGEAWREVEQGWRPLYGDFDQLGVSVEWHDFQSPRPLDWGRSFHPRSLEFCLNLEGRGAVGAPGRARSDYVPGNCGYYARADEPLIATDQLTEVSDFALTPKGIIVYFDFPHVIAYFDKNLVPYSVVKQYLKPNGPAARFQ